MNPLVTMVMPTANRLAYVPIAIRCFLQQTYDNKELIIVDDGQGLQSLEGLIPNDSRIEYLHYPMKLPTGEKRNIGAAHASGTIIANLDDDDWSHPHRLADQVGRLASTGRKVTGYFNTVIWDEANGKFYKNPGGRPHFSSGTSQCYLRSWWLEHPYPSVSHGEDSDFSRTARLANQLAVTDVGRMLIARKHPNNTDKVHVQHYRNMSEVEVSSEFKRALMNPSLSPTYLYAQHVCTMICTADMQNQQRFPVFSYKGENIPPIEMK